MNYIKGVVQSLIVIGLLSLGIARIFDSYNDVSLTDDEPDHIAAGVEWIVAGSYSYEEQHPPLARVAAATLPYFFGVTKFIEIAIDEIRFTNYVEKYPSLLAHYRKNISPLGKSMAQWGREHWHRSGKSAGRRILGMQDMHRYIQFDGDAILTQNQDSTRTLTLARAGLLPFFILGCMVIYLWAKEFGGYIGGISALFIFSFMPSVLANAGLAITDMAVCTTVLAALYIFWRWLEKRSIALSTCLGIASALAILSKFSAILFLPIGFASLWLGSLFFRSPKRNNRKNIYHDIFSTFIGVIVALLTIWGGYRFSYEPFNYHFPSTVISLEDSRKLARTKLPAPELARGLLDVKKHAKDGHLAYLLGDKRSDGWWYFFPVALFFKTPLPVFFLMAIGIASGFKSQFKAKRTGVIVITICLLAFLLSVMLSTITIGLRHMLATYGFISILGGIGVQHLLRGEKQFGVSAAIAIFMLGSIAFSSLRIHPQYIPYFNVVEKLIDNPILVSSDRDWNQAVGLVRDYVTEEEIQSIWATSISPEDIENYQLEKFTFLPRHREVSGWIAAGYGEVHLIDGYKWLQNHAPIKTIGNSVYIYKLP